MIKGKEIPPVEYAPHMFEGRQALLEGVAINQDGDAVMTGTDWSAIIHKDQPWPSDVTGKRIQTFGTFKSITPTQDTPPDVSENFELVDGTWNLIALEDQVGKRVALRGRAILNADHSLIQYRGTKLYVDPTETLPLPRRDIHRKPVIVRGTLERAQLPPLDREARRAGVKLAECFVIRNPTWEIIPELLFPDMPPASERAGPFILSDDPTGYLQEVGSSPKT